MFAAKRPRMYDDESSKNSDDSDEFDEESLFPSDSFPENSDLSSNYEYDSGQVSQDEEIIDETLIKNRLLKALNNVANVAASEFAISGSLSDVPLHAISIKVRNKNDVNCLGGPSIILFSQQNQKIIRFPLFEDDLPSIIEAFKQSPYGKGTETIIDASFRNSWHLDPDDIVVGIYIRQKKKLLKSE